VAWGDDGGGRLVDRLSFGFWPTNSGNTRLSLSLLEVNSTAQKSEVAVSMARCTLRLWR
jgi:hypothetical protein